MKRLLIKLASDNTFMLNLNFYKQINGCTMCGPLSVIFSNIYIARTKHEIFKTTNPRFYKRFANGIISKKKINRTYCLRIQITTTSISSIPLKQCHKSFLTLILFMKVIKLKPKCTEIPNTQDD